MIDTDNLSNGCSETMDFQNGMFEITFLGTSGSCAHNNGYRSKYGSDTPCIAVMAGNDVLIFDAGSGICRFNALHDYQQQHLHVFFSHYHMDHMEGLLFLPSLFDARQQIDFYGGDYNGKDCGDIIRDFLLPPLFPVGMETFKAQSRFHTLTTGQIVSLSRDIDVRTLALSHPGGALGYRIEYCGKVLCYCTDVALSGHRNDDALRVFLQDADLLILDAFFRDGHVLTDWGHSSWREAAEWAKAASVKKLALFHYSYSINDAEIDHMAEMAQEIFPHTFAPADRMRISI